MNDEHRAVERALGWAPGRASLTPLTGGRSNRSYLVTGGATPLVLKVYEAAGSEMFPNDPHAEWTALERLSPMGLAPEPVARVTIGTKPGLIYTHVTGTIGASAHLLGRALARLHTVRDWSGLRRLPRAGAQTSETLVAHLPGGMALSRLRPPRRVAPPAADVLLHGDPVPSNVVTTPQGITFIDWQCPALGPPEEDLFLALSPGMAHVYGQAPAAMDTLLDGYRSEPVAMRLRARLPELHWRMACYCHLRASESAAGYAAARDIEMRALKKAR